MRNGMLAYTAALEEVGVDKTGLKQRRRLHVSAAQDLSLSGLGLTSRAVSLVVTLPPYLGVHVLYNRWQIQGRKELKLPLLHR